jgi:hypothetical protein
MECRTPGSDLWDEAPYSLVDGDSKIIVVSPGHGLIISVSNAFAMGYKNGRCRLGVRLDDGTFVKSNDFEVQPQIG